MANYDAWLDAPYEHPESYDMSYGPAIYIGGSRREIDEDYEYEREWERRHYDE